MKKLLFSVLFLSTVVLATEARAVPSLDFQPPGPITVKVGDVVNVSVDVSGLGGQIVAAYNLDILYDAALLHPASVVLNLNPLGGTDNSLSATDISISGLVNAWAVSLLSDADLAGIQGPLGGSFPLVNLEFNAIGAGTSTIALGPLDAALGKDVKGFDNTPIIPTTVPEPGTVFLVAFGFAGLGLVRALKRS